MRHIKSLCSYPGVRVDKSKLVVKKKMLCKLWWFLGRQEDITQQSAGIFQQFRYNPTEQAAAYFEGRVGIDLAQPRLAMLVHQKIQPEHLKTKPSPGPNQPRIAHCVTYIPRDAFDFGQYFLIEVESSVVEAVFINIVIRQLIGRLMLPIIFHVLLNSVVGQVYTLGHLLQRKLLRSCPNVALLVPVKLKTAPDLHPQHIAPDIELALLVEHGSDVLLEEVGPVLSGGGMVEHMVDGLLGGAEDSDSAAPVGELPGFEYPLAVVAADVLDRLLPVEAGQQVRLGHLVVRIDADLLVVGHHVAVEQLLVGYLPVVGQVVGYQQPLGVYHSLRGLAQLEEPVLEPSWRLLPLCEEQLLHPGQLGHHLVEAATKTPPLLLITPVLLAHTLLVILDQPVDVALAEYLLRPDEVDADLALPLLLAHHVPPDALLQRLPHQQPVVAPVHPPPPNPRPLFVRNGQPERKRDQLGDVGVGVGVVELWGRGEGEFFYLLVAVGASEVQGVLEGGVLSLSRQPHCVELAHAEYLLADRLLPARTLFLLLARLLPHRHTADVHYFVLLRQVDYLEGLSLGHRDNVHFDAGLPQEIAAVARRAESRVVLVIAQRVLQFGYSREFYIHGLLPIYPLLHLYLFNPTFVTIRIHSYLL